MKFSHLQQIVEFMQPLEKIAAIYRVDDTTLKIVFDRDETLYFAMQKSDPHIFTCKDFGRAKVYQAPFDVVLAKSFNRAFIDKIELYNHDKILQIHALQHGAYKKSKVLLQLEFTGKTANAIILDDKGEVLEALRHVDANASYRVVKVGTTLLDPPPPPYTPKPYPLEDVKSYLEEAYERRMHLKLEAYKAQKRAQLEKKMQRFENLYAALPKQESLLDTARHEQQTGQVILAQMHQIKPYQTAFDVADFEGNTLHVTLPKAFAKVSDMADHFFKNSKRLAKKAHSLHIEREGIEEKIRFLRHFIQTVDEATLLSELKTLFPVKNQLQRSDISESFETFFFEGYKIMLGKSEKGNSVVLEKAKARDIWLHLKDAPSAHVIIVTDKQNVPQEVIMYAARLCVDFSVFEKGRYLVDYTPRREVKIQEGAHVLYYNYKTLAIEKG